MPFSDTRGFVLSAAACAVVLALSGCGGGGGSASTTPPPGRSMAQLDPEPVMLPEGVTLATAGTFTIEPGESVDRDGARFTCAAGGPACSVVVAERAGGGYAATATGGEVRVAAAPVPAPPGGGEQPGGMEEVDWPWPDWPVADAAAARSLLGGSALSWSPSEIRDRIREVVDSPGWGVGTSIAGAPACGRGGIVATPNPPNARCDREYQPVMTYQHGGSIPIVQARVLDLYTPPPPGARSVGVAAIGVEEKRGEGISLAGFLDNGYFHVSWGRNHIELDRETEAIWVLGLGSESDSIAEYQQRTDLSLGRWEGALVGTGKSPTSPLYRQFIIGDVDVTVELLSVLLPDFNYDGNLLWDGDERVVEVELSNVRNVNTGTPVTLSHTQWRLNPYSSIRNRGRDRSTLGGALFDEGFFDATSGPATTPGHMSLNFTSLNDAEVFGVFATEEALGAFGARKQ